VGNSPLLLATFAKGFAFTGIGTPFELDPFSETNYVVSLEGVINGVVFCDVP